MRAWTWILCGLIAGTALAQQPAQPRPLDRTIATVNGATISGDYFYRRMENMSGMGFMNGQRFVERTPGYITLRTLIDEELLVQLARERGVAPTPAEIEAEVERRFANTPGLRDFYRTIGWGEAEVEREVLVTLSDFKVQTMGVNVADMEVETHYQSNPEMYTIPGTYSLRMLGANDQAGRDAIDARLNGGEDFQEVAADTVESPLSPDNGQVLELSEFQLGPEARAAIDGIEPGQVTGWVIGETRSYRFLKVAYEPSQLLPLDDELKRQIRRRLMMDRGRVLNDLDAMMDEMRRKSLIDFPGVGFGEALLEDMRGGQ